MENKVIKKVYNDHIFYGQIENEKKNGRGVEVYKTYRIDGRWENNELVHGIIWYKDLSYNEIK